jgi:hypothetical protein
MVIYFDGVKNIRGETGLNRKWRYVGKYLFHRVLGDKVSEVTG